MDRYTIRVELHDADEEDYEKLHGAMEEGRFTHTIVAKDGTTYKLPSAEYNYEGEIEIGEVREKAKSAAATTNRKYAILISQITSRLWFGLEEVYRAGEEW